MSLAEVKASIQEMTVDERLEIAALIAHLNRDDPEYKKELDRRMAEIDCGRKTSPARIEAIHEIEAIYEKFGKR